LITLGDLDAAKEDATEASNLLLKTLNFWEDYHQSGWHPELALLKLMILV
jgi:hypothetical protein